MSSTLVVLSFACILYTVVHKVTSKSREGGLSQGWTVRFTDCRGLSLTVQLSRVQLFSVLQVENSERLAAILSIEVHIQPAGLRGIYTASISH